MDRIRTLIWRGSVPSVLLESLAGTGAALLLVFSVVRDIPATNIPATFFFFVQAPVLWAALRLAPAPGAAWIKTAGREALFALALRVLVFGLAWGLASAFQVEDLIRQGFTRSWLNLVLYTPAFLPFLVYRLLGYALVRWRRLIQTNLVWTLVNSHLVVVLTLIAIFTLLMRLASTGGAIDKYVPTNLLAFIVLELVRSVIPWVGVGLILLFVTEAAFIPPAILVSYLTSRRFVRRIDALAAAMRQARQGDLGARVEPAGADEIAQLQSDFNHMAAQLQQEREKVDQLLKDQRELAAVVSHELRTPITVMRAYVENNLLERSAGLPPAVGRDLEIVHHEILALQSLVDDLFTLSRLDARQLDLDCAWIDPAPTLARVLAAYRPLAWNNKRIDLSARPRPTLPRVWGDARRLEQAIGNLAQNAIRHTPDGGVVVLRAEPCGDWLEISLSDSGEGITADDLPRVWERFYRGGKGRAAGRTGIGLSLVKDLVEAMDGSVGVESRPGEGSRFWLRLRLQPGPA